MSQHLTQLAPHTIGIQAQDIQCLHNAKQFKSTLLSQIASAKQRIVITVLYLQDDEAGREIIELLCQAKLNRPELDIKVFVDLHRAQRGLIGEKASEGNRRLYRSIQQSYGVELAIYGVPVKSKELFGVLHLKGMIFDDTVLYSGASINNIYCHQEHGYRSDRYHLITSGGLANSLCEFVNKVFVENACAGRLDQAQIFDKPWLKRQAKQLKLTLKKTLYTSFINESTPGPVTITPLVGQGKSRNQLNQCIRQLISDSKHSLVLFTPYFNLPNTLKTEVRRALKRGVQVDIFVGDKSANDFYLASDKPFTTIGVIPYIYEQLLKKFMKQLNKYIANGQLTINLWRDQENSYHLKGIVADNQFHLLTGNNLNPRAWHLDLENGLLIHDANQLLLPMWEEELAHIKQHTMELVTSRLLPSINDYPPQPKRLLRRLRVAQIDRLLKRLL